MTPLKTYGSGNGTGKDKEDVGVSPAGWLTSLPLLEPHYQILFAHALATGYIECDGKRTEFIDAPFMRRIGAAEVSLVNGFGCNVIRSRTIQICLLRALVRIEGSYLARHLRRRRHDCRSLW